MLQNHVIDVVEQDRGVSYALIAVRVSKKLLYQVQVKGSRNEVVHLHVAQIVVVSIQKHLANTLNMLSLSSQLR